MVSPPSPTSTESTPGTKSAPTRADSTSKDEDEEDQNNGTIEHQRLLDDEIDKEDKIPMVAAEPIQTSPEDGVVVAVATALAEDEPISTSLNPEGDTTATTTSVSATITTGVVALEEAAPSSFQHEQQETEGPYYGSEHQAPPTSSSDIMRVQLDEEVPMEQVIDKPSGNNNKMGKSSRLLCILAIVIIVLLLIGMIVGVTWGIQLSRRVNNNQSPSPSLLPPPPTVTNTTTSPSASPNLIVDDDDALKTCASVSDESYQLDWTMAYDPESLFTFGFAAGENVLVFMERAVNGFAILVSNLTSPLRSTQYVSSGCDCPNGDLEVFSIGVSGNAKRAAFATRTTNGTWVTIVDRLGFTVAEDQVGSSIPVQVNEFFQQVPNNLTIPVATVHQVVMNEAGSAFAYLWSFTGEDNEDVSQNMRLSYRFIDDTASYEDLYGNERFQLLRLLDIGGEEDESLLPFLTTLTRYSRLQMLATDGLLVSSSGSFVHWFDSEGLYFGVSYSSLVSSIIDPASPVTPFFLSDGMANNVLVGFPLMYVYPLDNVFLETTTSELQVPVFGHESFISDPIGAFSKDGNVLAIAYHYTDTDGNSVARVLIYRLPSPDEDFPKENDDTNDDGTDDGFNNGGGGDGSSKIPGELVGFELDQVVDLRPGISELPPSSPTQSPDTNIKVNETFEEEGGGGNDETASTTGTNGTANGSFFVGTVLAIHLDETGARLTVVTTLAIMSFTLQPC